MPPSFTSLVFSLLDFSSACSVDITFLDKCSNSPGGSSFTGLRPNCLFALDEVAPILHMYCPFVAEEDIRAFLWWYCSSVSEGEKLSHCFGIWSGKLRVYGAAADGPFCSPDRSLVPRLLHFGHLSQESLEQVVRFKFWSLPHDAATPHYSYWWRK